MKIVCIEAEDISSYDREAMPEDHDFITIPIRIVGFLIKETKDAYFVAAYHYPDRQQVEYVTGIPKGTVTKISRLRR